MRAEWSNTLDYTHMHWAFASVGEDLSIYVNDTHNQREGFMGLKNVKKIVSFGGWGFSTEQSTYDILRKAMDPDHRNTFVKNLVTFATETGIDGIDMDWEYPGVSHIGDALYSRVIMS
jgi:GH18 family chitinase